MTIIVCFTGYKTDRENDNSFFICIHIVHEVLIRHRLWRKMAFNKFKREILVINRMA